MKVLFLSAIADFLISEIQNSLSPEQRVFFRFHEDLTISLEEADLIFMDYSLSEFKDLFYDVLKFKQKVAIVIAEDDYDNINKILYETGVNHLFTISEDLKQMNFISDMKEFILNWSKEWTPESFIQKPKNLTSIKFVSSKGIGEQISSLLAGHDFSKSFDNLPIFITHILEEAIPNALFHAPVNSSGNFLYREQQRSDAVNMVPGKEVEVKLFSDEEKFVISVKDFYGSLTANNIFDYLPKEGEKRREGMRLGMYLIFRYGHKYFINVSRNEYTENIIVIENSRRFKAYEIREKSFHFFFKKLKQI